MSTLALVPLAALLTTPATQEPGAPTPGSFIARADGFWAWFAGEADAIHAAMFEDEIHAFTRQLTRRTSRVVPGIGWSFGPGATEGRHALILTGEGDPHQRLLTEAWVARAPAIDGWDVHPAKPPSDVDGMVLEVFERSFAFDECRVAVTVDEERQVADLVVHCDAFGGLDEEQRATPMFLMIDDCLGEDATELWVGRVDASAEPAPQAALTLSELRDALAMIAEENEWPSAGGSKNWTVYSLRERERPSEMPRGDVIAGTTCIPRLVAEFYANDGAPPDPVRRTGAEYAFLRVPLDAVPEGFERERLEDAVGAGFDAGIVVGGATGTEFLYVDLLLLDRKRAIEQLRAAVAGADDVRDARLMPFARSGLEPVDLKGR